MHHRRVTSRRPFLLLTALLLAPVAGCNTAKLNPAPDASPHCDVPVPEAPCTALTDGGAGCTGDLGSAALLGRDVVVDASYPPGCTILVNYPTPDEDNQCSQVGSCNCRQDPDAGTLAWQCFQ